jgi:hypothetical protein
MKKYLLIAAILLTGMAVSAKKVRFAVDMTGQTISPAGVHVSGDFQEEAGYPGGDWQPNTTLMSMEAGTEIYSVVVDVPAGAKYEYKYINGDQWYEVEFVPVESRVGYNFNDDRWVYIDSLYTDTTMISPVLFSGNAPAGQYLLRLIVDLQAEAFINPDGVHVAGDFQGWEPSQTIMYNFVDKVYEYIAYVDTAAGYSEYRFVNGNAAGNYEAVPSECSSNGNRTLIVPKDTVTPAVCFSSCSACGPQWVTDALQPSVARIYPNPCSDKAVLEFNDSEAIHKVAIMDILGNVQRVYDNYRKESLEIRCDNLENGVYFIRMENGSGWLSTLRLVISN